MLLPHLLLACLLLFGGARCVDDSEGGEGGGRQPAADGGEAAEAAASAAQDRGGGAGAGAGAAGALSAAEERDRVGGDQLALEAGKPPYYGPGAGAHLPPPPHFYHGPPPPPLDALDKLYAPAPAPDAAWPAPMPDMPKIISLDVKCERDLMKVYLGFDKPFYGIVFSKGHYSNVNCVHLPAGLGRKAAAFDISIHACGTAGNSENGLYGYGADSGSGTYFENIIVVQYDPQVQEVWDQARKLRCTWHDQYEKSVTFRPFPVDMLDVVRADFAGDNVGCWMQIQVGKGPWASEVSGLVKIGQTMTMVLAIKDDDSKFDMLVRNCMAHDGKRAPIQLVDQRGCVTRPKLMSRFTKIKNFGASASVLSYAHFQAFKFPDSMEVHFQCTIQICRNQCPDQCSEAAPLPLYGPDTIYGPPPQPLEAYLAAAGSARPRDERRVRRQRREVPPHDARRQQDASGSPPPEKSVGVNRVIRVVSTGDLTFPLDEASRAQPIPVAEGSPDASASASGPLSEPAPHLICMTTPGFAATLVVLLAVLLASCLASALLCVRLRPLLAAAHKGRRLHVAPPPTQPPLPKARSCFYS